MFFSGVVLLEDVRWWISFTLILIVPLVAKECVVPIIALDQVRNGLWWKIIVLLVYLVCWLKNRKDGGNFAAIHINYTASTECVVLFTFGDDPVRFFSKTGGSTTISHSPSALMVKGTLSEWPILLLAGWLFVKMFTIFCVHNLCFYLRLFWPTLLVLTLQLAIWVGFGYNLQLCRNDQIWDLTGFKERIPDQLVVFFRQETMKHIRIQTGSRKTIHWKMPAGRGYVKFPGGYQISNLSNTTCENGYPPKTPFSTKMKGTHVLKFWHVSPSWDGWCQKHPKTLIFICNIDELI